MRRCWPWCCSYPAQAATSSALVRVRLTSWGSHWAMTAVAVAGYLAGRGLRRGAPAAVCLVAAMGMHLLFDAPQPVIFLKVLINFAVVLAFYLRLRRGYVARARAALTGQVTSGALPDSEAPAVLARRSRRRLRHQAKPGPVRDQVAAASRPHSATSNRRQLTNRQDSPHGCPDGRVAGAALVSPGLCLPRGDFRRWTLML